MNFYKITGQVTKACSAFLKEIGFKNIKGFEIVHNGVEISMKDGTKAGIRFDDPGSKGVHWSIWDFEARAKENWADRGPEIEADHWTKMYDPGKFQHALDLMIGHYDAGIGISWDTIDHWLDEVCLIKKKQ